VANVGVTSIAQPPFLGNVQPVRSRHPTSRISLWPYLALALVVATANAKRTPTPTPSPAPPRTPDAEFVSIADEFIRGYLAARPLQATSLGIHDFDGRITDFNRLAIDAELARLKRFDERLKKFDLTKLSPQSAIDLRLLQTAINRELFQIQDAGIFEHNPMAYARAIDVNVYVKRNFAPIEDRVRSIVAIENQAPNVIIAAKTNLADVLPRPYVELAIQIARGSSEFLKKNLVEAIGEMKDEALRVAFTASNRKAATALADYANWLEKEKLPKANAPFALGAEKYQRLLAQTELVDLPPDKLLEIGMSELKREQEVFAEAAKKIDPNKPAIEVFKAIQNEHPSAENLLPEIGKHLDSIRQYVIDRKLVTIPSPVRAQLKETPQYRRATSFASMDTPGAFEKKGTEAYYYVTPTEADWPQAQKDEWLTSFNYYTADVVTIHEAYPGHYVQFLHLNASKASKMEKIFGSTAFIEGWAHYCEKMVVDDGFGGSKPVAASVSPAPSGKPAADTAASTAQPSDDEVKRAAKYRMAQSDEALLRLCRLCVSVKMHTQNMSVDDATKFFQDNCYYEAKPARSEAMRGTFNPEYLSYTLGKLQILKLRKDFEAQEGEQFNQQKFHDALLDHGMMPIRLLREVLLKDQAKWPEVL
jgi:uncharacterized protein (DUF885 family)